MYGMFEKIRRREIRRQNEGHKEMNGKFWLAIIIAGAITFAAMVWIAN